MLPYILVIVSLILIIFLLFYYQTHSKNITLKDKQHMDFSGKPCPLCQSLLQKNERVHSVIYRAQSDVTMHIYGCKYCYKDHPKVEFDKLAVKKCPSCNKNLEPNEFVIARLFEKPGKNHVHVLGCYRCRGKR